MGDGGHRDGATPERAPSLWRRLVAAFRGPDTSHPLAPQAIARSLPTHVPLVPLSSRGNATLALRSVFTAYGIAHDADDIDRQCNVTIDGTASIEDLERVALAHGLDAAEVLVPVERLLLPEAQLLPAIVVVHGAVGALILVLVWSVEEERVQILDGDGSCRWLAVEEVFSWLYVHAHEVDGGVLRGCVALTLRGERSRPQTPDSRRAP